MCIFTFSLFFFNIQTVWNDSLTKYSRKRFKHVILNLVKMPVITLMSIYACYLPIFVTDIFENLDLVLYIFFLFCHLFFMINKKKKKYKCQCILFCVIKVFQQSYKSTLSQSWEDRYRFNFWIHYTHVIIFFHYWYDFKLQFCF